MKKKYLVSYQFFTGGEKGGVGREELSCLPLRDAQGIPTGAYMATPHICVSYIRPGMTRHFTCADSTCATDLEMLTPGVTYAFCLNNDGNCATDIENTTITPGVSWKCWE